MTWILMLQLEKSLLFQKWLLNQRVLIPPYQALVHSQWSRLWWQQYAHPQCYHQAQRLGTRTSEKESWSCCPAWVCHKESWQVVQGQGYFLKWCLPSPSHCQRRLLSWLCQSQRLLVGADMTGGSTGLSKDPTGKSDRCSSCKLVSSSSCYCLSCSRSPSTILNFVYELSSNNTIRDYLTLDIKIIKFGEHVNQTNPVTFLPGVITIWH